jgi:hypothetical protein
VGNDYIEEGEAQIDKLSLLSFKEIRNKTAPVGNIIPFILRTNL